MGAVLFNLPVPDPPEGGVVAQGVEETIRAVSRDPEVASVYAGLMASVRTMAWQADRMGEAGRPSGRAQFFKPLNEALTTLAEAGARQAGGSQLDAALAVILDPDTEAEDAQGDDL